MMKNRFTIVTDLGGVVISVDKKPMCAELAKYSSLAPEEICSHFSSSKLTDTDKAFGKGLLTPRQFYERMARKLKLKGLSFQQFAQIYCNIFKRKEEVIRELHNLSKKHVIALLSNTDALHYKRWARLLGDDMKVFKDVILSFKVKAVKPEPKIFLEAARRLSVQPQMCVYIDDIEEYADAAAKLGMKGIRFVSVEQLQTDLKKIGICVYG